MRVDSACHATTPACDTQHLRRQWWMPFRCLSARCSLTSARSTGSIPPGVSQCRIRGSTTSFINTVGASCDDLGMESRTALSAESRAAVEAVAASAAVLAAFAGAGADRSDPPGADPLPDADPLRGLADGCLDGLAEVARLEARTAALKVRLTADYVQAARALAPPARVPAGPHRPGDGPGRRGRLCPDRQRTHRRGPPLRIPGPDDGAAADPGGPAVRDDLLAARPDHRRRNQQPGPGRGGRRWKRTSWTPTHPTPPAAARPGTSSRPGSGPRPAPGANATTPPASKNATPRAPRTGGSSTPGPGRHGLALRPPPGRHRRRDLGTDHRRRPRPPGPGRDPDPRPSSAPTSPPPGSSPTAPAPRGATDGRRRHRHGRGVRAGVFRPRGRRSWSPSRSCPCSAPPTNRPSWTGTGRSRRPWPAA